MMAFPKPGKKEKRKSAGLRRGGPIKAKRDKPKKQQNPLKQIGQKKRTRVVGGLDDSKFSPKVRQQIYDRDERQCVFFLLRGKWPDNPPVPELRCARPVEGIHHIIYAGQGGAGSVENGALVCHHHHDWAHGLIKLDPNEEPQTGRRWFERYAERYLIGGQQDGE